MCQFLSAIVTISKHPKVLCLDLKSHDETIRLLKRKEMTRCECGEELTMEMEKDSNLCVECQKAYAELPDTAKIFLASSDYSGHQSYLHGYAKASLYGVANYCVDPIRINREYLALARYAKECLSDKEGSEA